MSIFDHPPKKTLNPYNFYIQCRNTAFALALECPCNCWEFRFKGKAGQISDNRNSTQVLKVWEWGVETLSSTYSPFGRCKGKMRTVGNMRASAGYIRQLTRENIPNTQPRYLGAVVCSWWSWEMPPGNVLLSWCLWNRGSPTLIPPWWGSSAWSPLDSQAYRNRIFVMLQWQAVLSTFGSGFIDNRASVVTHSLSHALLLILVNCFWTMSSNEILCRQVHWAIPEPISTAA